MKEIDLERWGEFVTTLEIEPLFVSVSGAHIFGFPSADSDVDLRGCHAAPLRKIVGLMSVSETLDRTTMEDGVEVDLVSHEIGKYFRLMATNNGNVLERVFSPLVVSGHDFLEQLKPIAAKCISRYHAKHYLGFYKSKRKMLENQPLKEAKSLLYAYRVLMTGIHLMNSGRIESNLVVLNEDQGLPFIDQLIASKLKEKIVLPELDWDFHAGQLDALEVKLQTAFDESKLPDHGDPTQLNELLINLRLGT